MLKPSWNREIYSPRAVQPARGSIVTQIRDSLRSRHKMEPPVDAGVAPNVCEFQSSWRRGFLAKNRKHQTGMGEALKARYSAQTASCLGSPREDPRWQLLLLDILHGFCLRNST